MSKPLCFVLMPFGTKSDGNKNEINFDKVYNTFIKPAIVEAGLDPIRADEEKGGGFIHKPMYERLMFCSFAVADLSFANANVFYELGIRHALKPYTTVSIFETNTKLPFDASPLRTFPYDYKDGVILNLETKIKELADRIRENLDLDKKALIDSPIPQMIKNYEFPDLLKLQTESDSFSEWVSITKNSKEELEELVSKWKSLEKEKNKLPDNDPKENDLSVSQLELLNKVKEINKNAGNELKYNFDLLYSILGSYKSMNAFEEITSLLKLIVDVDNSSNEYLKQQLALAYNKINEREKSEKILDGIIKQYGPDPETNGLLGAVYKKMMDDNKDDPMLSKQYCEKAIDTYLSGFDSDPRYYYPGINALTLMYLNDMKDERYEKFIPLVKYAIERQLAKKAKDYWAEVSALELAALRLDKDDVNKYYGRALSTNPDKWMKNSTADNLKRIYDKAIKNSNDEDLKWLADVIGRLE